MNKSFPVVFGHMLFELGMFIEVPESAEDAALKNYATRLLRIFGGGEVKELTIQNLLKNLVGQSLSDDRETNNKEG